MEKGRTHLIGIKGTGMSALASLLSDEGAQVSGSDIDQHVFTQDALEARGIPILSFDPANVSGVAEVIHSASFGPDHPEVAQARRLHIPTYTYPQYLGRLTSERTSICVCGTHGKTTTTGMLVQIWEAAGRRPSFIIGDGTGAGGSDEFILEACEYRRHFLEYSPRDTIMLNIDFDHPDYFKDLQDTVEAFASFARRTQELIVACGDDANVRRTLAEFGEKPRVVYYGFEAENAYRAVEAESGPKGQRYTLVDRGRERGEIRLFVPGLHNVLNSLGAAALALERGIPFDRVQAGLAAFKGTHRRFEVDHVGPGVLVDDYAHHPAEIAATIRSARERFPGRRIVAVFQPHTFTRTQAFLDDFARSLSEADSVWLMEIFGSARESAGAVRSTHLLEAVGSKGKLVDFEQLVDEGKEALEAGSVLLLMGAGDIYKVKDRLKES